MTVRGEAIGNSAACLVLGKWRSGRCSADPPAECRPARPLCRRLGRREPWRKRTGTHLAEPNDPPRRNRPLARPRGPSTTVSIMSSNGVPIQEISDTVGHKSTHVTETVYRHVIVPEIRGGVTRDGRRLRRRLRRRRRLRWLLAAHRRTFRHQLGYRLLSHACLPGRAAAGTPQVPARLCQLRPGPGEPPVDRSG